MKRFSQTLKVMLALFVAIFSNGLLPATVAYASTDHTDRGTWQPVWCHAVGGGKWQVQLGSGSGEERYALHTLPADASEDYTVIDGQVYAHDRDDKLQAACAEEYNSPSSPTATSAEGICKLADAVYTREVTLTIKNTSDLQGSPAVYNWSVWKNSVFQVESDTTSSVADGMSINVSAQLAPGDYQFRATGSDNTTVAPYDFTVSSCDTPPILTQVTAVDGTFDDTCGDTFNTTFKPTKTEGIEYITSVNGNTMIVTAKVTDASKYILTNQDWTQSHTDNLAPCRKVTICHRTNSVTNPYVKITVSEEAVDEVAGNSGNEPDHYGEHQGPIASSEAVAQALKDNKEDWGDIIPPVGNHSGLNWTTIGQAMLDNDCNYVTEVTPAVPVKYDFCYDDQDGIYVPTTEGVVYKVNGVETSGWIHYTGEDLVVTAETTDSNWVFSEGAITEWTFGENDFTNESCLVITKSAKYLEDTNKDGMASEGDLVKWTVTVTNNGSTKLNETFTVVVEDSGATFTDNGKDTYTIDSLEVGKPVTLEVSKPLTVSDLQVCKATNKASFTAWRTIMQYNERSLSSAVVDDGEAVFTGTTDTVDFNFTCPTPGSGNGGSTTTTTSGEMPAELPATGPADSSNPLLVLAAAAIAYGATYFIQRRRELASN